MPLPTPFYPRTAGLCESHDWRDWAGYLAASTYEAGGHEREYYAIRQSAALIDVSPLFKYEVTGPDAQRLLNRVMTRDVSRCAVGQVMYAPWCDDEGKLVDDGTVARLSDRRFRVTAAEPNLRWFQDCGAGMDAEVADVSRDLAALALQGPNARRILQAATTTSAVPLEHLGYYRLTTATIAGSQITITRTGFTGDLGYELWVKPDEALTVWDALMEAGSAWGITPAGMVALDLARIEAGLLLATVDYIPSPHAHNASQTSSPFEAGLGWTVALGKGDFVGRRALQAEKARGSTWQFVGLHVDWDSLEGLFNAVNLAPAVAGRASRSAVPIYRRGRQIGQATSQAFSPLLKRYIAIGTVGRHHAKPGTPVEIEFTVEYVRRRARAIVVETPFFDPPRKRA